MISIAVFSRADVNSPREDDNLDVIPYSPRLSTSQRKQATQNLQQYGIVLFQNVPVEYDLPPYRPAQC